MYTMTCYKCSAIMSASRVDNSKFLSEKQAQSKFGMIVKKYISKFIKRPVKNPKGKKWVKKQLLLKKAGVK